MPNDKVASKNGVNCTYKNPKSILQKVAKILSLCNTILSYSQLHKTLIVN